MPFKTLQSTYPHDKDLPARSFRLAALRRVIDGTMYDNLPHPFHTEKNDAGEYVPLRDRRPSVKYALCRIVVDDSVSMLFSEGHFPEIDCEDEATKETLQRIIKEAKINQVMIEGATSGSVGSVALMFRVIKGRVFVDVSPTENLTPTWNHDAPDELLKVTEQYKVKGRALKDFGYAIKDDNLNADHWFMREWDALAETWYMPTLVSDKKLPSKVDKDSTVKHSLGFVPVIWVKNLPGGDKIDGVCTFPPEAIDANIEIDYLLSQGGRGLKYSADPTLLIKEPAVGSDGPMVRGAGNAIVVGTDGDAKMLEINGTATAALMDYVRMVRELALESAHGNKSSNEKMAGVQSGRALEIMNQALVWLADKLRISYGEGALLELLQMIVKASAKIQLSFKDGTKAGKLSDDAISLRWPAWYQSTPSDRQSDANTLKTLTDASLMSAETATKAVAADYDIEDVPAELVLIAKDRAIREAAATKTIAIQE